MIKFGNAPTPSQTRIDFMKAEASRRMELQKTKSAGDLRRLGLAPGPVDTFKLQDAIRAAKLEPRAAIQLKSELASIGWLD